MMKNKQKLETAQFEMHVFQAAHYIFPFQARLDAPRKKTIVFRAKLDVSNSGISFFCLGPSYTFQKRDMFFVSGEARRFKQRDMFLVSGEARRFKQRNMFVSDQVKHFKQRDIFRFGPT